jgi:hypothetical protein
LYGTDGASSLFTVDRSNAELTFVKALSSGGVNGMDVSPSGDLYAIGVDVGPIGFGCVTAWPNSARRLRLHVPGEHPPVDLAVGAGVEIA